MRPEQKVYCVVPTHNRLNALKQVLYLLNEQTYPHITIVVIDDGSTDGTREYLEILNQRNLVVLRGDGKLWWGGAIARGINYVLARASNIDYILMLNDDSTFNEDYIDAIVATSRIGKGVTVVSPQCDYASKRVIQTGYKISYKNQEILRTNDQDVDATVGRGLLVPVSVVKRVGNLNYRLFRHYMGDIEFTARIKEKGFRLVISELGKIYTDLTESDGHIRKRGIFISLLHPRSKINIQNRLLLFSIRGPVYYRLTAVPRFFVKFISGLTKRIMRRFRNQ